MQKPELAGFLFYQVRQVRVSVANESPDLPAKLHHDVCMGRLRHPV